MNEEIRCELLFVKVSSLLDLFYNPILTLEYTVHELLYVRRRHLTTSIDSGDGDGGVSPVKFGDERESGPLDLGCYERQFVFQILGE